MTCFRRSPSRTSCESTSSSSSSPGINRTSTATSTSTTIRSSGNETSHVSRKSNRPQQLPLSSTHASQSSLTSLCNSLPQRTSNIMTTEAVVHSHRSRSRSRGKQRNLINHPVFATNDGSTSRTYDSFQSLQHHQQEQHQQHLLIHPSSSSISFCRRRGTSMESPHSYQYPGQQHTQYFPGSYNEAMYVKRGPSTSQSLHSFPTSSSPVVSGQEAISFSRGRRMIPGFNNLPMEVSGSVSSVANSDITLTHRTRGRCMTDSYPLNQRHQPSPSSSSTHFIPISRSMLSSHPPPPPPPSSTMSTPRSHPRHHRNKLIVQEKANHSATHSSSSTSIDSSCHSSQNQFSHNYQYPSHCFQQHQPHPVTQVIRIRPLLHSIPSEVFTNNQLSSGAVSPSGEENSRSTSQSSVLYLSTRDDNNSEHNENTDNNNHRTHPSLTMQAVDCGDDESKL